MSNFVWTKVEPGQNISWGISHDQVAHPDARWKQLVHLKSMIFCDSCYCEWSQFETIVQTRFIHIDKRYFHWLNLQRLLKNQKKLILDQLFVHYMHQRYNLLPLIQHLVMKFEVIQHILMFKPRYFHILQSEPNFLSSLFKKNYTLLTQ